MSKARPWPTQAMWARDGAAESLIEVVRALEPVVAGERQISETEIIRRTARALAQANKALRILTEAGARVEGISDF